jgi:hypothetical protein
MRALVELIGGAHLSARRDFQAALDALGAPLPGGKGVQTRESVSRPDIEDKKIYRFHLAETYLPKYCGWYQTAPHSIPDIGVAQNDPRNVLELLAPLAADKKFI